MKGLADALGMDYTTILGLNIGYDGKCEQPTTLHTFRASAIASQR